MKKIIGKFSDIHIREINAITPHTDETVLEKMFKDKPYVLGNFSGDKFNISFACFLKYLLPFFQTGMDINKDYEAHFYVEEDRFYLVGIMDIQNENT